MTVKLGLLARLEAKPGKGDALGACSSKAAEHWRWQKQAQ
jgi:hypothetical protein